MKKKNKADKLNEAYKDGLNAAYRHGKYSTYTSTPINPYKINTPEATAWMDGFADGTEDLIELQDGAEDLITLKEF